MPAYFQARKFRRAITTLAGTRGRLPEPPATLPGIRGRLSKPPTTLVRTWGRLPAPPTTLAGLRPSRFPPPHEAGMVPGPIPDGLGRRKGLRGMELCHTDDRHAAPAQAGGSGRGLQELRDRGGAGEDDRRPDGGPDHPRCRRSPTTMAAMPRRARWRRPWWLEAKDEGGRMKDEILTSAGPSPPSSSFPPHALRPYPPRRSFAELRSTDEGAAQRARRQDRCHSGRPAGASGNPRSAGRSRGSARSPRRAGTTGRGRPAGDSRSAG